MWDSGRMKNPEADMTFSALYYRASDMRFDRARTIGRAILRFLGCCVVLIAFLVMGSDGPYFPWANFSGTAVLAVTAWICNRREQRAGK